MVEKFLFNYNDWVRCLEDLTTGHVVGGYVTAKGVLWISYENVDKECVYSRPASTLEMLSEAKEGCKHDQGFGYQHAEKGHNHFTCNLGCGYSLNFHPDNFEDTIAYYERELAKEDVVHNF